MITITTKSKGTSIMIVLKTVYFIHLLPALVIHELSHVVAILLTGTKFTGIDIQFNLKERTASVEIWHRGQVKSKWVQILISMAPYLTWITMLLVVSILPLTPAIILFIYLWTARTVFWTSDHDNENILKAWRI